MVTIAVQAAAWVYLGGAQANTLHCFSAMVVKPQFPISCMRGQGSCANSRSTGSLAGSPAKSGESRESSTRSHSLIQASTEDLGGSEGQVNTAIRDCVSFCRQ
jgi:hypothetical protein